MNLVARIVVATFPLVSLVGGCSSQSEGQRCDIPEDCESGLACNKDGYCCPPSGKSSAPACNPGIAPPDSGPKTDAGPDTSASAESSVEASDEVADEATTETSAPESSPDETSTAVEASADAPTE